MPNILISRLHNHAPVSRRFPAEKRAEKIRVVQESDRLRQRVLRYLGRDKTLQSVRVDSNVGVGAVAWSNWMGGTTLPNKYHMALAGFLAERGF